MGNAGNWERGMSTKRCVAAVSYINKEEKEVVILKNEVLENSDIGASKHVI